MKKFLQLSILIILVEITVSCTKEYPTTITNNTSSGGTVFPPPPPPSPSPTTKGVASFWTKNPYGELDNWWYYPNGFGYVTIDSFVEIIQYTLHPNGPDTCGSNKSVNFNLSPGIYNWRANAMNGYLLDSGLVTVNIGECTSIKINY